MVRDNDRQINKYLRAERGIHTSELDSLALSLETQPEQQQQYLTTKDLWRFLTAEDFAAQTHWQMFVEKKTCFRWEGNLGVCVCWSMFRTTNPGIHSPHNKLLPKDIIMRWALMGKHTRRTPSSTSLSSYHIDFVVTHFPLESSTHSSPIAHYLLDNTHTGIQWQIALYSMYFYHLEITSQSLGSIKVA